MLFGLPRENGRSGVGGGPAELAASYEPVSEGARTPRSGIRGRGAIGRARHTGAGYAAVLLVLLVLLVTPRLNGLAVW